MDIKYIGEKALSHLISKCKETFALINHTHTASDVGADITGSASAALALAEQYTNEQIETVEESLDKKLETSVFEEYKAEINETVDGKTEKYTVTITYDSTTDSYSADKTYDEVTEALDKNLVVEAVYQGYVYRYVGKDIKANVWRHLFELYWLNEGKVDEYFGIEKRVITVQSNGYAYHFIWTADLGTLMGDKTVSWLETTDKTISGAINELNSGKADADHVHSWNDLEDKPFGEEIGLATIIPETNVTATGTSATTLAKIDGINSSILTKGQTYTVTFDGIEYEVTSAEDSLTGGQYLGNILGMTGDYPFCILDDVDGYSYAREAGVYLIAEAGEHTVKVETESEVLVKLDEKYLPDHTHSWNDLTDKPFGTKELEYFYNDAVTVEGTTATIYPNRSVGNGDTYQVYIWGSSAYDGTMTSHSATNYGINQLTFESGNIPIESIMWNASSTNNEYTITFTQDMTGTFTLQVYELDQDIIDELDEQFIPDTIARTSDLETHVEESNERLTALEESSFYSPYPVLRVGKDLSYNLFPAIIVDVGELVPGTVYRERPEDYSMVSFVVVCDDGTEKYICSHWVYNEIRTTQAQSGSDDELNQWDIIMYINNSRYVIDVLDKSTADNVTFTVAYNTDYLSTSNTSEYSPTSDYNPATKKYVDEAINEVNEKASAQADWNENDESSKAFIKNKPFDKIETESVLVDESTLSTWIEYNDTVVAEVEYNNMSEVSTYAISPSVLALNTTYKVTWDGTEYDLVCFLDNTNGYYHCLGGTIDNFEEYPFSIVNESTYLFVYIPASEGTSVSHTLKISVDTVEYITIDENYIPDTIARQSSLEAYAFSTTLINHKGRLSYNGISYRTYYSSYAYFLTDNGLWKIEMPFNTTGYRLVYETSSGILALYSLEYVDYSEVLGEVTSDMYATLYDINTGSILKSDSYISSVTIGEYSKCCGNFGFQVDSNTVALEDIHSFDDPLPVVTSDDNGSVLKVVDGVWAKAEAPKQVFMITATTTSTASEEGIETYLLAPEYTLDKTFEEISAAISAGHLPVLYTPDTGYMFNLSYHSDRQLAFNLHAMGGNEIISMIFVITNTDRVIYQEQTYSLAPPVTSANNGQILSVVNGVPTWIDMPTATDSEVTAMLTELGLTETE